MPSGFFLSGFLPEINSSTFVEMPFQRPSAALHFSVAAHAEREPIVPAELAIAKTEKAAVEAFESEVEAAITEPTVAKEATEAVANAAWLRVIGIKLPFLNENSLNIIS